MLNKKEINVILECLKVYEKKENNHYLLTEFNKTKDSLIEKFHRLINDKKKTSTAESLRAAFRYMAKNNIGYRWYSEAMENVGDKAYLCYRKKTLNEFKKKRLLKWEELND